MNSNYMASATRVHKKPPAVLGDLTRRFAEVMAAYEAARRLANDEPSALLDNTARLLRDEVALLAHALLRASLDRPEPQPIDRLNAIWRLRREAIDGGDRRLAEMWRDVHRGERHAIAASLH